MGKKIRAQVAGKCVQIYGIKNFRSLHISDKVEVPINSLFASSILINSFIRTTCKTLLPLLFPFLKIGCHLTDWSLPEKYFGNKKTLTLNFEFTYTIDSNCNLKSREIAKTVTAALPTIRKHIYDAMLDAIAQSSNSYCKVGGI